MGQTDYKYLLKAFNLSINQKKVLYAVCMSPTAHPYSYISMYPDYKFTSGGIKSGLKKLTYFDLVMKDNAGVWQLKNTGMQEWLRAIKVHNDMDYAESLRFGEWPNNDGTKKPKNKGKEIAKRISEMETVIEQQKTTMRELLCLNEEQIERALQPSICFRDQLIEEAEYYEISPNVLEINPHTKDSRTAITKMVMRLFDLWQISVADQAVLLNRSLSTIIRYRNGGRFADDVYMHDLICNILGIHKNLRIIYPHNRDLVYSWPTARNQAFKGQEPIEVMKKGFRGIIKVRSYLEFILQS